MKRVTFPMVALGAGWLAAMVGTGLATDWGQALIGWGIAAIAFAFFAWVWSS